jgi:hypothetical protein
MGNYANITVSVLKIMKERNETRPYYSRHRKHSRYFRLHGADISDLNYRLERGVRRSSCALIYSSG